MILDTLEAETRLNSADNLINKLAASRLTNRSVKTEVSNLFGIKEIEGPQNGAVLPPGVDELIDNVEDKLNLGLAHDGAIEVMKESIAMLGRNLINIDPSKPEKLSRIAQEMSRIVHTIDEVRNGSKSNNNNAPTIIYRPVMMAENHYETVHVHE